MKKLRQEIENFHQRGCESFDDLSTDEARLAVGLYMSGLSNAAADDLIATHYGAELASSIGAYLVSFEINDQRGSLKFDENKAEKLEQLTDALFKGAASAAKRTINKLFEEVEEDYQDAMSDPRNFVDEDFEAYRQAQVGVQLP